MAQRPNPNDTSPWTSSPWTSSILDELKGYSGERCTRAVAARGSGKSLLFGASSLLSWASRHDTLPWYGIDPDFDDVAAAWDDWGLTANDLLGALRDLWEEIPDEEVHPAQQSLFDLRAGQSGN